MDATSEHEDKFRIVAEHRIREALESGALDVKTGPDQILDLEDNPYVPADMRMSYHLLKNSHYRPDWMVLGDEIDADLAAWRRAADQHFAFLRDRLDALTTERGGLRRMREEIAALKQRHQRATAHHAQGLAEINRKIHRYNATVPAPGLMRGTLFADDEMHRFADRLPAYLTY
ncbi:MAG TPA: DnaJ family domain-containing protein [Chloroflexia bacterium]|nr:DnaJ family domain-containing protein [Chloroflexia bacterium]